MYAIVVARTHAEVLKTNSQWEVAPSSPDKLSKLPPGLVWQFAVQRGESKYGHVLIAENYDQATRQCARANLDYLAGQNDLRDKLSNLLGFCQKEQR